MRVWPKRTWVRVVLVVVVVIVAAGWYLKPEPIPFRGSGEPMNAAVYYEYGPPDVVRYEQTEKPLPNDNQVVIKVHAASANPLDWHYMRGAPYIMRALDSGLSKPNSPRLGVDVAGAVTAVGKDVTQFKPGDQVFGTADGSFAEFARASQRRIILKPAGITFEQAAALPVAAITALQALRDTGHIHAGQKVLINGASGGVGTFAVQIAKSYGAEVTGVCSGRNAELVRSLGADRIIDYTTEDFTQGGERYDLILDTVGNRGPAEIRRVMTPKGIAVLIGGGRPSASESLLGPIASTLNAKLYSMFVSQQLTSMLADVTQQDLGVLVDLMKQQKLRSVIDRTYPLDETREALRYLEAGHARGKVMISVGNTPVTSMR